MADSISTLKRREASFTSFFGLVTVGGIIVAFGFIPFAIGAWRLVFGNGGEVGATVAWLVVGMSALLIGGALSLFAGSVLLKHEPAFDSDSYGGLHPRSIGAGIGKLFRRPPPPEQPRPTDLPLVLLDDRKVYRMPPEPIDSGADENEDRLRRSLPARLPAQAAELGRPRFRLENLDTWEPSAGLLFWLFAGSTPGWGALFFNLRYLLGGKFTNQTAAETTKYIGIALVWVFICLGLAIPVVLRLRRALKMTRIAFAEGMAEYTGSRWRIWRWSDFASCNVLRVNVHSYVYFIPVHQFFNIVYTLRHRDGTEITFQKTRGPRCAQFGPIVERETFLRIMPEARRQLGVGKSVEFSPFRLEPTGLCYRNHFTPWSEVGPLTIEDGELWIAGAGMQHRPVRADLATIDNCHVFLPLLVEILEQMTE